MYKLEIPDGSLGGVVALYSISHIPRQDVTPVLREIGRILADDAQLMLTVHKGDRVYHRTEWYGKAVSMDWTFFTRDEMRTYLSIAGFEMVELVERRPYPDLERFECNRLSIRARKTNGLRISHW